MMKKIDSPDNVSLIKRQLEAQTRKHDLVKNQIPDHEQFLKVSTKQCSFCILRQESGCSGYQIIATRPPQTVPSFSLLFLVFVDLFFVALLSSFLLEEQRLGTVFLQNGAI